MKTRLWISRAVCALVVGLSFALPATAQNFPFPSRGGSSIGLGDIINIVGSSRNGQVGVNNNRRGQDRTSAVIGLAGVLYDLSRQGGRQPNYPGNYPQPGNNYPGIGYPGAGYPTGNYPSNGNSGYYPGQGNGYPGYPNSGGQGRPDGYAYIEHNGQPVRLDPRILPLTINAGGGHGDEVLGRAIQTWNNAGVGQVFALTNGPADLTIDWSGSKVSQGARAETRMIRSRDFVMPTDLSVKTNGRTPDQIARVMTHELGHVLGLEHSRSRSDVMYESEQDGPVALTQRDLSALTWLYAQQSYVPVVGRTNVSGAPSVANNWSSHGLEATAESVCSHHRH